MECCLKGLCVWLFLELKWYRAFAGVIVAKMASIVIGTVPIWTIGLPIDAFLRSALTRPTTQLLVGHAIAQIVVSAINTAIEWPILVMFGVRLEWRSAVVIYANFISVALLILPLT